MAQSPKCSVKIVSERDTAKLEAAVAALIDGGYTIHAFVVVEGVGFRALMVKLK